MTANRRNVAAALIAVGLFLLAATAASAARPPDGRTYFVVSLGVASDRSEAYEVDVGCVQFSDDEFCEDDGACGTWFRTTAGLQTLKQSSIGFEYTLIDDETGATVQIDGQGRVDDRGAKSSMGAVARGLEAGSSSKINFAFAARAVSPARCLELVATHERRSR